MPGCFGRPLFDCVASLAQTLVVTDWYQSSQMFYAPPTDVNGKPIRLKQLELNIYRPGVKPSLEDLSSRPALPSSYSKLVRVDESLLDERDRLPLRLNFSDQNLVNEISLNFDLSAKTQEQYDRLGVYELFSIVAKDSCPALTRNELARFIENKLKPALQSRKVPHIVGSHDVKGTETAYLAFCGRQLKLSDFVGYTSQFKKKDNPLGEYGGTYLYIR